VRRAVFVCALWLFGCAGPAALERAWDRPSESFLSTWEERARTTQTLAYLAEADYEAEGERSSFTLEIFYAAPDRYVLRGRGALGATGFRARLEGDSLVLLLTRERRGFAGRIEDYPDTTAKEMWRLLQAGLPWLTGKVDLRNQLKGSWRVRLTRQATRPTNIWVALDSRHLELDYGRFRSDYPFWHLYEVRGWVGTSRLTLKMRQRLHNPDLDGELFRLELPLGTRPLLD